MVPSGEFVVAYRADKLLLRNNIIRMFLDRIYLRAIVSALWYPTNDSFYKSYARIDYFIRL